MGVGAIRQQIIGNRSSAVARQVVLAAHTGRLSRAHRGIGGGQLSHAHRGTSVMMALLAVATILAVNVPGEQCASIPASGTCTAMLEYILVVDNSWSMRTHYSGISEFMHRVTGSFALNTQSRFSPRVGIVTLAGGFQDGKTQHARVLHPLSDNVASITAAINGRPAPSREKGYTCISCGLDLAASLLRSLKRSEAKPIVMVLTDGEQTVWGLNNAAMQAADELKNAGADIVAMSLGACPRVALRVPRRREGPLNRRTASSYQAKRPST